MRRPVSKIVHLILNRSNLTPEIFRYHLPNNVWIKNDRFNLMQGQQNRPRQSLLQVSVPALNHCTLVLELHYGVCLLQYPLLLCLYLLQQLVPCRVRSLNTIKADCYILKHPEHIQRSSGVPTGGFDLVNKYLSRDGFWSVHLSAN